MAVTASFKKESPMDEILNGKSIKANFEAQVTAGTYEQKKSRFDQPCASSLMEIKRDRKRKKNNRHKKRRPKGSSF